VRRRDGHPLERGIVLFVLLLAAVVVGGLVAAGLVLAGLDEGRRAHRFDAKVWKKPVSPCDRSARNAMVDDLIATRLKKGTPMRNVRALLGRPMSTAGGTRWDYAVGSEPDGLMDACVYLELYVSRGRLVRAELYRDS
jgi:outer membrane protein assembly factor BamE (lipoprotein component of BamABCDE complex)